MKELTLDLAHFAETLRATRELRKVRRATLAKSAGISYKALANMEAGHHWPSMPVYIAICRTLQMNKPPFIR